MNFPNPPASVNSDDDPLWLIVQRAEVTQCFEFPADTHKAIVVGSTNNADVRISGAAPVAFFLERDGKKFWLTPAYSELDIRVDTLKINGRRELYAHGLVELANVELRLQIRDTPPTLRGDGSVRINPEVSDPIAKRAGVHSAKTVEFDAFNFDGRFESPTSNVSANPTPAAAVAPGRRMSTLNVKTQEMAPFKLPPEPSVDRIGEERTPVEPVRPMRTSVGPLNVKTQEMAPFKLPPEPKLDPYRTIVIAPVRLPDSKPPSGNTKIADTTEFEVPVVKTTAKAEPIVANSTSGGGDPRFQGHDSDRPVSASSPSAVVRTLSAPSKALSRLGMLAQQRPVLVIGGAAIGSLVLVLFFAGAAKVMSPHAKQVPAKAVATQPAAATPNSRQGSTKAPVNKSAMVKADAVASTAQPQLPSETKASTPPEAIAAIPDVTPAVGHLFAGRLPEAEQAYRELSAKFPNEPAYQSASKILARKNRAACRGASPSKTLCPSVKP